MPELPEVETIRRGLESRLVRRRLTDIRQMRADLRFPIPSGLPAALNGRRVEALGRRGKYLLIHCEDALSLLIHLGMSGRLVLRDGPLPEPGLHDHLLFATDGGFSFILHDPRRFGMVDLVPEAGLRTHPRLAGLGPEPLDPAFTGTLLARRLAGKRTSIKAALLDQTVVAGLGNIYVSESLFHAGIHPMRQASTVNGRAVAGLAGAIRRVLTDAIAAGGSSLRDYVDADGALGYFQTRFAVYGRDGAACPGCRCDITQTGGILRLVQSNRATFYCPRRQR